MAYAPAPIRRDSVITRAAQELCRLIEAEDLGPGSPLPTETRLAQMLGISRNSVREALRVLHGLGYVEKAAGRRVVVTAASRSGNGIFDESVTLEAASVANEVRSLITQRCAELAAERLTLAELATLEQTLATFEEAVAREDITAARAAHDRFYAQFLTGARNPVLAAMFNQASVARLSTVSPEHKSFFEPRHVAHHRALMRALRKRDKRAAKAVVRKHYQSLGQMLEVVSHSGTKRPSSDVVPLIPDAKRSAS